MTKQLDLPYNTVKSAHVVTSIKQSLVFKGHLSGFMSIIMSPQKCHRCSSDKLSHLKFNYRNDLDLNEHKIYLKLGLFTVLLPTVTIRFYDEKNRESIRDATAELQVKFIWSTLGAFILSIDPDHKYIWLRGGDFNH